MSNHWHQPAPPATTRVDLSISVAPGPAWNVALAQRQAVAVHAILLKTVTPRAVSIPIKKSAVRVRSFVFPEPTVVAPFEPERAAAQPVAVSEEQSAMAAQCSTRIKPPADMIKLSDRLQYILQPSLESLLAEGSLAFPFRPFPFQFEGIAFLYPRQAAILADEMGLGKTMQAITAIRLLLRRGEVRSVLLVCPKPLVTNWQREFSVWAPEVPLMVVEGDHTKREWQLVEAVR